MSRPLTRRELLLGAAALGGLAACSPGTKPPATGASGSSPPTTPASPSPTEPGSPATTTTGGLAAFVNHGPKADLVALTFHGSGDVGLVGQLLDEVKRAGVPVTIFVVGQWLAANPSFGHRILADGHELANHTLTHPTLSRLAAPAVTKEITGCRDALSHVTGAPGKWFRPSGVETRPSDLILRSAAEAGYPTVVGFDVDPMDYQDPGADAVVSRTAAGLHPGAIVSLHTGHAGTVSALPRIIDALQSRSLQPVTVSDLLAAG